MFVGQLGHFPPPRSPVNKALLDQKRLIYFFNGFGIFTYSSCERRETNRASFEFINYGGKDLIVHFIQAMSINIKCLKAITSHLNIYLSVSFYLGKIAYPS